jgi:hypothetical protein
MDGSDTFLQTVRPFLNYTALQLRRPAVGTSNPKITLFMIFWSILD